MQRTVEVTVRVEVFSKKISKEDRISSVKTIADNGETVKIDTEEDH